MQLTADEAKKFWPLYDAYQRDLDKINTRQTRAILDFINSESSMTDANAKRIAREVMAADADEQKLKERTARKMLDALPAKKAVRFLQIENKIRALQRYDIAEQMRLGLARVIDDAPLTDRAVDQMLANLDPRRTQG